MLYCTVHNDGPIYIYIHNTKGRPAWAARGTDGKGKGKGKDDDERLPGNAPVIGNGQMYT